MTSVTDDQIECSPPPPTGSARRVTRGYASGKTDYLTRLRKIEGQVRGLQRMIEDDKWCPDVVTQVASTTRALQEVAVGLLNDHLRHCVVTRCVRPTATGTPASTRSPGPYDRSYACEFAAPHKGGRRRR